MTSYLGSELVTEVFESDGGFVGEDVAPVSGASSAGDVAFGNSVLTSPSLNPVRSFEVFLGRRYDPAEATVLGDPIDDGLAPAAVVKPSQSTAEVLAVATALEKGLSKRRTGAGGAGAGRDAASLASLETPLQRYHRLASEVSALEAELAAVAAADARRPAKATPVDPAAGVWRGLTAGVSELGGRLERLQPSVAALAAGSSADASGSSSAAASAAASRRSEPSPSCSFDPAGDDLGLDSVIVSLERMAGELSMMEGDGGADASGGSAGTNAAAAAAVAAARSTAAAVDVESRVAALETALLVSAPLTGSSASAAAGVAAPAPAALSSRLAALESRVALLTEPGALEAVAARAKAAAAVVTDAAASSARSAASSGAPASSSPSGSSSASSGFVAISDSRIAAAVAALERWDSVAAALPHIADRLASLRDVHREAAAAPRRITSLEAAVRSTGAELEADSAVLREVRAGLVDLARTVKANLELLPARSA